MLIRTLYFGPFYPKGLFMSTIVPNRKLSQRTWLLLTAGMLLSAGASAANNTFTPNNRISGYLAPADTILVQKQVNSKKHKVKLYPNASHQVLFFNVTGDDGKVYQLYLFDVEGKLVKQANIRNKETTVLNNIGKGTFLYEVFVDDERLENGSVIIR